MNSHVRLTLSPPSNNHNIYCFFPINTPSTAGEIDNWNRPTLDFLPHARRNLSTIARVRCANLASFHRCSSISYDTCHVWRATVLIQNRAARLILLLGQSLKFRAQIISPSCRVGINRWKVYYELVKSDLPRYFSTAGHDDHGPVTFDATPGGWLGARCARSCPSSDSETKLMQIGTEDKIQWRIHRGGGRWGRSPPLRVEKIIFLNIYNCSLFQKNCFPQTIETSDTNCFL